MIATRSRALQLAKIHIEYEKPSLFTYNISQKRLPPIRAWLPIHGILGRNLRLDEMPSAENIFDVAGESLFVGVTFQFWGTNTQLLHIGTKYR